jgi:galactokinase
VNLIGEHTDYHDGFVLPCTVPQRTFAILSPRPDRQVQLSSEQMGDCAEYTLGHETKTGGWADYVQGITWALRERNPPLCGFELRLRSDVPVGSGLSSSAALEVATLRAIRAAFALPLSDLELAQTAQRAETDFVGAPVGIMDQMACSLAGERDALFLDTRSLTYQRIPLPDRLELVVINSGVPHQHAGGGYVDRRRESEEAARLLGVRWLRDAGVADLPRLANLPPLLASRARHVITENDRVLRARQALLADDLQTLGELFNASHASMRDDYQISVPAVDRLVELANGAAGVFGARMTGGGFGGAIVIAVSAGVGARVASQVCDEYAHQTGRRAHTLVPVSV